jgi:hypothetical protein
MGRIAGLGLLHLLLMDYYEGLAYSPCVATGAQNLNESITISEAKSCKTTGAP